MLQIGDLIDYPEAPESRIRVLWFPGSGLSVVVIHVDDPKAMPEFRSLAEILGDLDSGRACLLLADPYRAFVVEEKLNDRYRTIRDRNWRLIEPLVNSVPDIFVGHRRGKLIKALVEKSHHKGFGLSPRSIYTNLRRFWQRGLTPNALLPNYSKCGGKGKPRKSSDKKRGRPRAYGVSAGINITEDIRTIFQAAFRRCYASDRKRKWTLEDVYNQMIEDFFSDPIVDPEAGRTNYVPNALAEQLGGIPTRRQFSYWVEKDFNRLHVKRKRMGSRSYDKDLRGLLGTSNADLNGPGDRYQIDATIADVYLVSRLNRNWIIGRPVIYVVIDTYSRMIVGLYIGLEGPSWVGAMMALANTAEDKVEYCSRFGIDIEFEDWPCNFLPGALLGDRGELEGSMADTLADNFNISIENTPPFRADWKGIVELRFRLLPAKFKKYVPGYIETDYRARGGTDYRLDAVLDLDDFTRIIIDCVLYYNNDHEIDDYDMDRDLAAAEIPIIPGNIWEWGVHHRSGAMRKFPHDLVRFSLMPVDDAKVTAFGIKYRGNFYTCQKAIEELWFDQARQKKRWSVRISYDPRDLTQIYLHDEGHSLSYHVCTMTDRSRAFRDLSLMEIGQQRHREKNRKANDRDKAVRKVADLNAAIQAHVDNAMRKRSTQPEESNAARTRAIRENRACEKELNRQSETFRLGEFGLTSDRPGADVVLFPTHESGADDDYSLPSIDEILGGDGDDD